VNLLSISQICDDDLMVQLSKKECVFNNNVDDKFKAIVTANDFDFGK
jgi:hypothetical protein